MVHRAAKDTEAACPAGNYGQSGLGTGWAHLVNIARTSQTLRPKILAFDTRQRHLIACALVQFVNKEQQAVRFAGLEMPSFMSMIRSRQLINIGALTRQLRIGVSSNCPEANVQNIAFKRRNATLARILVAMAPEREGVKACGGFTMLRVLGRRAEEETAWDVAETLGTAL